MSQANLEQRVAALEKQFGAFLAKHEGTDCAKDWRRTRGAFTGDDLMKQVFEEGRRIRDAQKSRALGSGKSGRAIHDPARIGK